MPSSDLEYSARLSYTAVQKDIKLNVLVPMSLEWAEITNQTGAAVKVLIWADQQVEPTLLVTADVIFLSPKANTVVLFVDGISGYQETNKDYDSLQITETLNISYIGSGNGECVVVMGFKMLPETIPLALTDELKEYHQVSRDQVGQATPGSEYYRAKLATKIKQVGVD